MIYEVNFWNLDTRLFYIAIGYLSIIVLVHVHIVIATLVVL